MERRNEAAGEVKIMDSIKIRRMFAEAIIDAWNEDSWMSDVVNRTWHLLNKIPPSDGKEKYKTIERAIGASIYGSSKAKRWAAKYMRGMNDALWDGRKREFCLQRAYKDLHVSRTGANMKIKVRDRDKRRDWNTVK